MQKLTLAQFPMVLRAFQLIEGDNGGSVDDIDASKTVPKKWALKFEKSQAVLASIENLRVGDVEIATLWVDDYEGDLTIVTLNQLDHYESCEPGDSVLELVVNPCNESDKLLLQGAGVVTADIKALKSVLKSFFDGALQKQFVRRGGW